MLVLSFSSFIEGAIANKEIKHASGYVSSFDKLIRKESLRMLENKHKGLFAFLAFHPKSGQLVMEYIKQGTLASDSGPNILVLLTIDAEATWAIPVASDNFGAWINLDSSSHPSYQIIRIMFETTLIPPLPGIAFFEKFTAKREPVYVSLEGVTDGSKIKEVLRTAFALADYAYRSPKNKGSFADRFGVELQKKKIVYYRAGKKSMAEWLVKAYQLVWDNKGDLVSAVGLYKK